MSGKNDQDQTYRATAVIKRRWHHALRPAMQDTIGFGQKLIGGTIDLLFPPRCLSCGASVDQQRQFCATCWTQLHYIIDPLCISCGLPFELDVEADHLCASCISRPPLYHRHRSLWRYDGLAREMVLRLKHADQTLIASLMQDVSRLLLDKDLPENAILAPVPLHRFRLFKRRYNQAGILAEHLAKASGLQVRHALLERIKATKSQGGLSREGRKRNVSGAFRLHPRYASLVTGKTVILVDDVYTTGATIDACARVLHNAGAARIDAITLARVVRQ